VKMKKAIDQRNKMRGENLMQKWGYASDAVSEDEGGDEIVDEEEEPGEVSESVLREMHKGSPGEEIGYLMAVARHMTDDPAIKLAPDGEPDAEWIRRAEYLADPNSFESYGTFEDLDAADISKFWQQVPDNYGGSGVYEEWSAEMQTSRAHERGGRPYSSTEKQSDPASLKHDASGLEEKQNIIQKMISDILAESDSDLDEKSLSEIEDSVKKKLREGIFDRLGARASSLGKGLKRAGKGLGPTFKGQEVGAVDTSAEKFCHLLSGRAKNLRKFYIDMKKDFTKLQIDISKSSEGSKADIGAQGKIKALEAELAKAQKGEGDYEDVDPNVRKSDIEKIKKDMEKIKKDMELNEAKYTGRGTPAADIKNVGQAERPVQDPSKPLNPADFGDWPESPIKEKPPNPAEGAMSKGSVPYLALQEIAQAVKALDRLAAMCDEGTMSLDPKKQNKKIFTTFRQGQFE